MNKMIEINLLSEELKGKYEGKTKKSAVPFSAWLANFKVKYFIYLIPLALAVLICTHIYLGLMYFVKTGMLRQLANKWQGLEQQRSELDVFNAEYMAISEDAKAIQQISQSRINWAQKLNLLSLGLPSGIWFNEINVSPKEFILQGTVVAFQKEELVLINKLISNLKNDPVFFKDFNSLELSSVQKKTVGSYDIFDFILQGALK